MLAVKAAASKTRASLQAVSLSVHDYIANNHPHDIVAWLAVLQEQQLACMDACGNEYLGKVPKLKTDMSEDMKRLDQGY
jgi:hypothetical protein